MKSDSKAFELSNRKGGFVNNWSGEDHCEV